MKKIDTIIKRYEADYAKIRLFLNYPLDYRFPGVFVWREDCAITWDELVKQAKTILMLDEEL